MKQIFIIILTLHLISCGRDNNNSNVNNDKDSVVLNYENIPEVRTTINSNAIKNYSETIKSFETTDEFNVSLFETKKTFRYLVKIRYKQLNAEDTLRIPNFGIQPSVEIKAGNTRPSCIVGFYDDKKKFRESKLIYFENDKLKVRVLKYYSVATYRKDVK